MSAEDTLNEKSRRRRGFRRQQEEVEPEDNVEEVDDEIEEEDDEVSSGRGMTEKKGRATRGRRTQEVEVTQSEGNIVSRPLRGMGEYFEGVRSEAQKIVWPTREETRRLTTIVLIVTVVAALILGVISLIFNELFIIGIQSPVIFGVLFVIVVGIFLFYLRQSNRRGGSY
jgi:preprotein translocase SecE subunit